MEEELLVVKDKRFITSKNCISRKSANGKNDGSKEIQGGIARATEAMEQFGKIWRSKKISIGTKVSIIKSTVMRVAVHASETNVIDVQ